MTNNHWHSVDAQCQEIVLMSYQVILHIKVAETFSTDFNSQISDALPDLQYKQLLTVL